MSPLDLITEAMHPRIRERLGKHIIVKPEVGIYLDGIFSECWMWTAGTDPDGYARIKVGRRQQRAHRVSLLVHAEPDDPKPAPGALANHRCHRRLCINPKHLYWGSHAQNMEDLRKAGNAQGKYNHGRVTVTEETVKAVLVLHEHGKFNQSQIGRLLNFRQQLIGEIVNGKHFSTRKEST